MRQSLAVFPRWVPAGQQRVLAVVDSGPEITAAKLQLAAGGIRRVAEITHLCALTPVDN